ncbi:uncharacterized protein LOC119283591 [Triticum dicoccoides]|uniref:uncharacterized protein LOC119283591 n=1 Tax=Triticum dicoccoides TaxID=85692 RepID=UPI0018900366|nr:uncharacterized protein LOC119283591 [Triticum dicoccoides]
MRRRRNSFITMGAVMPMSFSLFNRCQTKARCFSPFARFPSHLPRFGPSTPHPRAIFVNVAIGHNSPSRSVEGPCWTDLRRPHRLGAHREPAVDLHCDYDRYLELEATPPSSASSSSTSAATGAIDVLPSHRIDRRKLPTGHLSMVEPRNQMPPSTTTTTTARR